MQRFNDARDWFFEKRFGLFLHFGIYAIEGWHEQDQMRRFLPRAAYGELIRRFNPQAFDADRILDLAEEAGMEYVCLTTKHHDGFCLWDTSYTDFNVMHSPYGKDLIRQLADACHARNFPMGLYYSVVDWRHPNYPNRGQSHELPGPLPGDKPDLEAYLEFLRGQVRELCTNYGTVHHFFWDMNQTGRVDPAINQMLRELQPGMVINDRGFDAGDFSTPEREYQAEKTGGIDCFERPTEACNSLGAESWGYRADEDYYSIRHLIGSIDAILAKGGNYLLNAGPDAQGRIPDRPTAMLRRIGEWYHKCREAFEGCEPATGSLDTRNVLLTSKGNSLYVHLGPFPQTEAVVLPPIEETPRRATLLNTGQPVTAEVELLPYFWPLKRKFLNLKGLPVDELSNEVLIVRLDFDRPLVDVCRDRAGQQAQSFKG